MIRGATVFLIISVYSGLFITSSLLDRISAGAIPLTLTCSGHVPTNKIQVSGCDLSGMYMCR